MIKSLVSGGKMLGKAWKGTSKKLIEFGKRHADPDSIELSDLSNIAKNKLDVSKANDFKNFLRQKRTTMGEIEGLQNAKPNYNPVRYVKTRGAKTVHDIGQFMKNPMDMAKRDIVDSKYHTVNIEGKKHLAKAKLPRRLWNLAATPTGYGTFAGATAAGGFFNKTNEGAKEYALWKLSPQAGFGKLVYDFNKARTV